MLTESPAAAASNVVRSILISCGGFTWDTMPPENQELR